MNRHKRTNHCVPRFWICLLFVLIEGCARRVENGTTTYMAERFVLIGTFAAGAIAIVFGVFLLVKSRKDFRSYLSLALAVVLLGHIGPKFAINKVIITSAYFQSEFGDWWAPKKQRVEVNKLAWMHVHEEIWRGRRGTKLPVYTFDCRLVSGDTITMQVGPFKEQAAAEIIRLVLKSGVRVTGIPNPKPPGSYRRSPFAKKHLDEFFTHLRRQTAMWKRIKATQKQHGLSDAELESLLKKHWISEFGDGASPPWETDKKTRWELDVKWNVEAVKALIALHVGASGSHEDSFPTGPGKESPGHTVESPEVP